MKRRNVFMFSGQGSNYYQMGRPLFQQNQRFRFHMGNLDEVAADLLGASVLKIIYDDANPKSKVFDRTLHTNPALFMVEYSLASVLIENNVKPDVVLGASLGTYVAICASNCGGPFDVLTTVINLARIFETSCARGGMIAVMDRLQTYSSDSLLEECDVAASNFDRQFVLSARAEALNAIHEALGRRNIASHRLPVSIPFHSRWTDVAESTSLDLLESLRLRSSDIPVFCCANLTATREVGPKFLWRSTRGRMEFAKVCAQVERLGPCRYIDLGPTGTLATFLKYILPTASASEVWSIMSPLGRDVEKLDDLLRA